MKKNSNIAIIFAAGYGVRMGDGIPKQFLKVNKKPVLIHTLEIFQEHPEIDKIYIATLEDYIPYVQTIVKKYQIDKVVDILVGGATVHESVYNALTSAMRDNTGDDIVLIHDGVRPNVKKQVISDNIKSVKEHGNAITCIKYHETILLSKNGKEAKKTVKRNEVYVAQAPQSFRLQDIIEAHDKARATKGKYKDAVDSCTIMSEQGVEMYVVEGNRGNIKVTTPEDVYLFKALLQYKESEQAFGL
jgi:2-C-methyl-D-erythritol 4-phosphate cytidylyltransferase